LQGKIKFRGYVVKNKAEVGRASNVKMEIKE
jgi:hypothetical protein